jgi:hypothetical protein
MARLKYSGYCNEKANELTVKKNGGEEFIIWFMLRNDCTSRIEKRWYITSFMIYITE